MATTRIAVCSWTLRPAGPENLAERLRLTGLDGVQLALSPFVRDPETWRRDALVAGELGFRVASGMMAMAGEDYATLESIARTGGLRRDALWTEHRAHAAAVATLASEAAIDLVTFHAGFLPEGPDDPERAVLLDRLRAVADTFAAHGVRLGLETGQETAETFARVLDELDRPNVGVNFDPANMILYGKGDPVAALERLAPRVVQVHIKDALPTETPGTWGREVPVGDGAVDWPRFMAIAHAIEPAVEFVIEREAGADRTDDVRRAAAMVRSFADGGAA